MKFLFEIKDQSNYIVKEFYSKLKNYNLSKKYSKKHLKWLFLKGILFKNMFKILLDELQIFVLDEIIKRFSLK